MSVEKVVAKFKRERIAKLETMDIVEVAKMALAAPGDNVLMVDESEYAALVTRAAQKLYPNMRPDAAFAKLFTAPTEDGKLLRKAHQVIKSMPIQVSLMPMTSGGLEEQRAAINDTERSQAYEQLMQIGRDKWPSLSEAQRFARAVTENPALAAKAHKRPVATTSYPFPR